MINYLKSNLLTIAGILAGTLAGYLYWYYIGCSSGSCAITSRPFNSSLYGAVMGGLLFSSFEGLFKSDKDKPAEGGQEE